MLNYHTDIKPIFQVIQLIRFTMIQWKILIYFYYMFLEEIQTLQKGTKNSFMYNGSFYEAIGPGI